MWDVLGDVLGGPLFAPVIVVGAVVGIASSPTVRKRLREWGVQGLATAMAARDAASREFITGGNGTSGMVTQMSHRVMQAAAEVKEEWEDFVEEARHRQHHEGNMSSAHGREEPPYGVSEHRGPRAEATPQGDESAPKPTTRRRPQARRGGTVAKRTRRRELD